MKPGKATLVVLGGAGTIVLVMFALWSWHGAAEIVAHWGMRRPDVAAWAMRCFAISAAALSQVLLLTLVIQRIYGRDLIGDLMRLGAGLASAIAMVSAIALIWAGR